MSEIVAERDAIALPDASTPTLRAHLAGVALTSPDPEKLSQFYATTMGYQGEWEDGVWQGLLDRRWLSVCKGDVNTIDHVAFTMADDLAFSELKGRLSDASVAYKETSSHPFSGSAISLSDPDGNKLLFGTDVEDLQILAASTPCRLQHVVFASDETPVMVRFYCDVLGFAPSDYVKNPEGDLTSAFLRCSTEHHSLAVFRAPRKRMDHLCFDVADWSHIRDWADAFAKHHITLKWGPGRHGPGDNLFFFVNDPDGNWLEFSAELEVVEGTRQTGLWAHEERTLNSWGAAIMRS